MEDPELEQFVQPLQQLEVYELGAVELTNQTQ